MNCYCADCFNPHDVGLAFDHAYNELNGDLTNPRFKPEMDEYLRWLVETSSSR